MKGIRLLRLLDVLPVKSIRNAIGVSPRSLIVTGAGFADVVTVLVNGVEAPAFVVYKRTELIVEVPVDLRTVTITDVSVLSATNSFTAQSLIDLTLGTRVQGVSGKQRLLQSFIRLLLRSPGSNIFNRRSGGGLQTLVGTNMSKRLAGDIALAVSNVKQQILAAQAPERNLPAEERLLAAEIIGYTEDATNSAVYVTVAITTQAGDKSAATLLA